MISIRETPNAVESSVAVSPTGLRPVPVGAEAGAVVFSTVSTTWEATTRADQLRSALGL